MEAQTCSFTVSAPTLTFGNLDDFTPLTATSSSACNWSVSSNAPWLSGLASPFGPSTTFFFNVRADANTTGASRTGTISVNGQPAVSVTQGIEPCVSGFNPAVVHTTIDGTPQTAFIQTTTADCAWHVGQFCGLGGLSQPLGGIGSRVIGFNFIPNTNGTGPRSTDISYSGRSIHIDQDGPTCALSIAPATQRAGPNGGTFSFAITGVGTACDYTATVPSPLTVVSGGSGTAPSTLVLKVPVNTGGFQRSFFVQVQNASLNLTQDGSPISTDELFLQFGYFLPPSGASHLTAPARLRVTDTDPAATWTATTTAPWITLSPATGPSGGVLSVGIDPAVAAQMPDGFVNGTIDIRGDNAPDTPHFFQVSLNVRRAPASKPIGVFETPLAGAAAASGAIPVTGWTEDDLGVSRIAISRAAVAGESGAEIFIGDAIRVRDARPDVFTGYPDRRLAGWGYMLLTNVLPGGGNGTFTFFADVTDVEGQTVRFGPRTVTIDNAHASRPFGTIDVPAQGETVSGTIVNRGWVLTPAGKAVPFDGSTIRVYIDGVFLSPVASYNNPRPDVKAFFPGLANSDGPEARLSIDTTTLADGVHTIAWGVIDDAGVAEGIGSRYFTVQNGAASQTLARSTASRAAVTVDAMPALGTDVWSRAGVNNQGWAMRVETDADGVRTVHAAQGQRIEIFLDPTLQAGCGSYEGHLLTGDVAGPLPVGASLETQRGIFRWQPGAEFTGNFAFVFVHRGCDGIERRIPLKVELASSR